MTKKYTVRVEIFGVQSMRGIWTTGCLAGWTDENVHSILPSLLQKKQSEHWLKTLRERVHNQHRKKILLSPFLLLEISHRHLHFLILLRGVVVFSLYESRRY